MKVRTYAAAVMLLFSAWGLQAQEKTLGIIRGRVIDAATGESVPFMTVTITGTKYGTSTDPDGRFILGNIPEGTYELQVMGIGYVSASLPVRIRLSAPSQNVEMRVNQRSVPMNEVQIVLEAETRNADTPVSQQSLSSQTIQTQAGGMDDVARTISTLPGVAPMRIERNDLVVRGGAPFENLILVDGFECPTISHFAVQGTGMGSTSILSPEFIKRVDFSSGGFGVHMGDKLSSVLSLSLRDGATDRLRNTIMISATQFGLTFEGPAGNGGSYLISARRSFLEPVFNAYGMSFAPIYWDGLAKLTLVAGKTDKIELLAMGARDREQLFNDSKDKQATNDDLVFSDQDMVTGGLSWTHYTRRWYTRLALTDTWGAYTFVQPNADPSGQSMIDSYQNEASATFDALATLTDHTEFSAGVSARAVRYMERVDLGKIPWFLNLNHDLTRLSRYADTSGLKAAGYAQLSQTVGSVVLNAGVRADYFALLKDPLTTSPRFSIELKWPQPFEFSVSVGRYYQAPAYMWLANSYNLRLRQIGANHIIAGVSGHFGENWTVRLEGYRKDYFDYPVSLEGPCMTMFNTGSPGTNFRDFGLDSLVSKGRGTSRGIELLVKRKITDAPISGTLSLTYSETKFTMLDGITRPADHDQRFILNLIMDYRPHRRWEFTGRFLLYTGHPYTDRLLLDNGHIEQYIQTYNTLRVEVNHTLDLRITHHWKSANTALDFFVDVQNVYNRRPYDTPEIHIDRGIYRDRGMIGIVPSLGIKVSL